METTSVNLYFIRHGYPDYEHDSLTEVGKYQAEKTSEFLNTIKMDKIFASNKGRAIKTAEYLAKKQNKEIIICPWLSEDVAGGYAAKIENGRFINWYFWEQDTIELFHKLQNDKNWYLAKEMPPSIYEGTQFIGHEIDKWFKTFGIERNQKTNTYHQIGDAPDNIAVFAHGGMATLFLSSILNLSYPDYVSRFQVLETCGVVHIKINLDTLPSVQLIQYNGVYYDKNNLDNKLGI